MFNFKRVKLLETENDLLKTKVRDYEANYNQLKEDYKALELEQIAQGKRVCTGYCSSCKYGIPSMSYSVSATPMQNTSNMVYYPTVPETKYLCLLNCKCADFKNRYE